MASQIKMSPGIQLPEVPCELGAVALEAARLERIRQHAPELLAALEGVVNVNADIIAAYTDVIGTESEPGWIADIIAAYTDVIGTESEPGWIVDLREATDIARAAIRAARGI